MGRWSGGTYDNGDGTWSMVVSDSSGNTGGGVVDQGAAGADPWPVTQAQLRRTRDAVSAALVTDALLNGDTELTPKFAAIAAATSGANTLVAAVTSKKIRVLSLCIVAGAAGNIYFTSAAAGTVIFGGSTNKIQLAANGGFVLPFSPLGWFETVAGELLNMNASSTGPFSGGLTYVEV